MHVRHPRRGKGRYRRPADPDGGDPSRGNRHRRIGQGACRTGRALAMGGATGSGRSSRRASRRGSLEGGRRIGLRTENDSDIRHRSRRSSIPAAIRGTGRRPPECTPTTRRRSASRQHPPLTARESGLGEARPSSSSALGKTAWVKAARINIVDGWRRCRSSD